jgi:hypothetical protein
MAALDREYTLTLTRNNTKFSRYAGETTSVEDEGYGSSSPPQSAMSTIPMTIRERPTLRDRPGSPPSPTSHSEGSKKFRFPWGHGSKDIPDQMKRLIKEREAEEYIQSLSGRSLSIQLAMLVRVLTKEKRKVKFGFSSSKVMDVALRRYSYKSHTPSPSFLPLLSAKANRFSGSAN